MGATAANAFQQLPVALIDPPTIAMREKMHDGGIEALAESMRRHGQLQNIGVVITGDRYRVVYGHRRRVAAELAGLETLVARVFPEGTLDEEALKVAENEEIEPVNAAAQATYYHELLTERCGGDVRRLVAMVRRTETFILDRLDLVRGDPDVLAALRAGRINLSVAKELNKVPEDMYRRLYLHDAVHQGMNARAVRTLRMTRDRDRHVTEASATTTTPAVQPSTAVAIEHMDACILCGSPSDQHEMSYVKVHASCRTMWFREKAEKRAAGENGS